MSQDTWNPAQYERFKDERTQPFRDLLALVQPCDGGRVIDLGCGTGELTRALHEHTRARETLGVDRSASMLELSAAFASDALHFLRADIASFEESGWDVVFSNAALQWLPDHDTLIRRVASLVAPGGQLAVQMPANDDHPSHLTAAAVAREEPFRSALGGYVRPRSVLPVETYAVLLDELGFNPQHVRLQIYGHHLASRNEVIEWVKGTLLTDYAQRLSPAMYAAFLERYRERLLPALPDTRPYFYAFKRILFCARKPA